MRVAVITPWRDMPQLIDDYARVVTGALPVIVDTGSRKSHANALRRLAARLDGVYIQHEADPFSYAAACNAGIYAAIERDDVRVAVCLNNDVRGDSQWLARAAQLDDNVIAGPEIKTLRTEGMPHVYVDGWCVGATLKTWALVNYWDALSYVGCYHEDVDLSWRASRAGAFVRAVDWPIEHLGNTTSSKTPGVYSNHPYNRSVFARRVREWKASAL